MFEIDIFQFFCTNYTRGGPAHLGRLIYGNEKAMTKILRIDSSARIDGSVTRELTDDVLRRFPSADIKVRDLATTPLPQIDADWIGANFTQADDRDVAQRQRLEQSDALIAEIEAADVLVIGVPIYNFGVPTALKAWIDLVARAGRTFRYTETGPQGLLTGKRAIVVVASGGVPVDSPVDFATPYVRQFLSFVGVTDVTLITADTLMKDPENSRAIASAQIAAIAA